MIISLVLGPDHLSPTLIEKQVGGGRGATGQGGWAQRAEEPKANLPQLASSTLLAKLGLVRAPWLHTWPQPAVSRT